MDLVSLIVLLACLRHTIYETRKLASLCTDCPIYDLRPQLQHIIVCHRGIIRYCRYIDLLLIVFVYGWKKEKEEGKETIF